METRKKLQNLTHDGFLSADGWDEENLGADEWADDDDWADVDDDEWADADDEWAGANSMVRRPSQKTSLPYIIQIVNSTAVAVSNVDIGDSFTNRTTGTFTNGSLVAGNITTSSSVTGVSYLEFLAQSESQPFQVGMTMIICSTAGQLDQTVAITHRNAVGDRLDHVITPTLDPYQNLTDRIIDEYSFLFDGFTRLRFNQINGSATVTVRLYPKGKMSLTQAIAGRPASIKYDNPNVVKVMPVAVPRQIGKGRRPRRPRRRW